MIAKVKIVGVLLLLAAVLYGVLQLMGGGKPLTAEQKAAVDQAYAEAAAAVTARGAQLEQWYLEQKKYTPAAAAELTSLRSKWVVAKTAATGDDKQRQQYVNAIIAKHLYSTRDCEKGTAHHAALLIKDWLDVEDSLSMAADCPALGLKARETKVRHGNVVITDMDGELEQMLYTELGSLLGGEVASYVGIELATSAGLIGAGTLGSVETFGISLGLGILADIVVSWAMDVEGKIEAKLNEQVEKDAAAHRKNFESTMLQALQKRKADWMEQISNSN